MSRMSDRHASGAAERADEAGREVRRLAEVNDEMLAACHASIELILDHNRINHGGASDGYLWEAVARLRAAVAKATS